MDPTATAVFASWSLDGWTLGLLLAIGALYFRGWRRLHAELLHKYTPAKLGCFVAGLTTIMVALESPLDAFGSLLLQAHMIQHLLLISVAPPLLLLAQPVLPLMRGLPRRVFKDALGPFLSSRELKFAGRAIVHPVFTWTAFSTALVVWHLPKLYDLALQSPPWHEAEHACFFWTAMLFWWPVIGVWPGEPVWPRWAMIPYLVFASIVNMGLSAALSFSDHVIYTTYRLVPRLWGISALNDQAAAGGIMWVPGSITMLIPAAIIGMQCLQPRRERRTATLPRVLNSHPRRQFDLLRTPILGSILRYRHFRRSIQIAMLVVAALVAFDGFHGPQVAPINLAGVLPWTHWRGLAVIALLLAGNLFCMACPFTLPRDLARKFVSPRFHWPVPLRSKWIAVALLVTYLWTYEALSLWDRPSATAWIVVGYFAAAFAVDSVFRGASFCKYVCPIGQFHFVHSLISPLQVAVRRPEVCESCTTHDCIRGNEHQPPQRGCEMRLFQPKKRGNFDCTMCLDCVQACPSQNIGILPSVPAQMFRDDRHGSGIGRLTRRLDVAALALILVFGAFVNAAGMTEPVMMWMHQWHARIGSMIPVVTAMYAVGLLIVPAIVIVASGGISRLATQKSWKELTCSFTLALVPIGFSMWLAHFSNHFLSGWSTIIPALQRFFSGASSNASGSIPPWIPPLELYILDFGLLLTLYTVWRVARRIASSDTRALAVMSPWAVLAAALYSSGVWIVLQPMQMRGMAM
jgi:cytochrome c oxidase assembly factor CtaG